MRLALICTELTTVPPIKGGAVQTHIAGILPYLSRVHETTVICTEDKDLPVNEVREGVRYLRLPAPSTEGYLEHVCAAVASERFDLIHVFNRPAWLLRIGEAAPRSRIALRVHNDMFTPSKIGPDAAAAAIRRAGAIDTVSDFLTRRIADQYPQARAKLRTLYTGVDLERFWPHWTAEGEALRRQGRHDMGLGTDPVILFVGRLSSTKGPDILLQAMPLCCKLFPERSCSSSAAVGSERPSARTTASIWKPWLIHWAIGSASPVTCPPWKSSGSSPWPIYSFARRSGRSLWPVYRLRPWRRGCPSSRRRGAATWRRCSKTSTA